MDPAVAALLYLAAGVLFIMALRGLSSPVSSRMGNLYGMAGMTIAVVTTLIAAAPTADVLTWILIALGIGIGGGAGAYIAQRIPMTSMPQTRRRVPQPCRPRRRVRRAGRAAQPGGVRHSFRRRDQDGEPAGDGAWRRHRRDHLLRSVIAFLKLDGRMSGAPILLPMRHLINIGLALLLAGMIWGVVASEGAWWGILLFYLVVAASLVIGVTLIIPIGGADMPVVVSMLNSYSGWAAAALGFTLHNEALLITGALVGSSGAILSYIMCKGMNRASSRSSSAVSAARPRPATGGRKPGP